MIIQELRSYFQRLPQEEVAPAGYAPQEIKFMVEIDRNGRFVALVDQRGERGRGTRYAAPADPGAMTRTSASPSPATCYSLWETVGYLAGHPKSDSPRDVQRAAKQLEAFRHKVAQVAVDLPDVPGVRAIANFYETRQVDALKMSPLWEQCSSVAGAKMAFRLTDEAAPVFSDPRVVEYIVRQSTADEDSGTADVGRCLLTGERAAIALTHYATPIVGSRANAGLVSMQKSSGYDSYGRQQADNAPISVRAMHEYTKALNYLLASRRHTIRIGELTLIVWAPAKPTPAVAGFEAGFCELVDPSIAQRDGASAMLEDLRRAVFAGSGVARSDEEFCMLGLLPNAGRLSVALWSEMPVGRVVRQLVQHYQDLELVRPDWEPPQISLSDMVRAAAPQGKLDRAPRALAPRIVESIIGGAPYPMALYQGVMIRIRADRKPTYRQVAVVKACLNRWARRNQFRAEEVGVSLNASFDNYGYLLGRTLAVLERIQEQANPGRQINAPLLERYYGSASTSPATVFPLLMRLKVHHLAKIQQPSTKIYLERLLGEIMGVWPGGINYPEHLSLQDQGYFAIGYYHQRQELFSKRVASEGGSNENLDSEKE